MSEPRPLASLTAGLLARKGTARPAMRSSLHAPHNDVPSVDDLGWNDFGGQVPAPAGPQVLPFAVVTEPPPVSEVPAPPPVVVRQQQALQAQALGQPEPAPAEPAPVEPVRAEPAPAEPAPAEPAPLPVRKSALAQGRRAAFTLRLDSERHLALRVAATVLGRSAQQIVSEALDELIARHPEIHAIAGQIHGRR